MEQFGNLVLTVCLVCGGICAVENLTSGTRLAAQVRLILELVLVSVILMPLTKLPELELPDFERYSAPESSYSEELYNDELCRQAAENIEAVLREQLGAAGIAIGNISAEVNISEDGSIYISRVTVEADDFEAAAAAVRGSLGSETEVVDGNS